MNGTVRIQDDARSRGDRGRRAAGWRNRAALCLVLLGLVLAAGPGAMADDADDVVQLRTGARVRVTVLAQRKGVIGKALALDDTSLTLETEGGADTLLLRRDDVTSVATSAGRRSRGKSALMGAGVCAGVGLVVGLASGDDPKSSFISMTAPQKGLVLGILLAPVGALIGLALPPAERWHKVPLDRMHLSARGTPSGGVGASVTLAF